MLTHCYATAIIITIALAGWGALASIAITAAPITGAEATYALLAGATAGIAVAAAFALRRVWGRR